VTRVTVRGRMDINNAAIQPVEQTSEKMLTQSEVNSIVAAEKRKAYERGISELQAQSLPTLTAPVPATAPQAPAPVIDVDDAVAKALQKQKEKETKDAQELLMQQNVHKTLSSLQTKLTGIKDRIPDFEDIVRKSGLAEIDAIWALADTVDNAGETMHEIAKSPEKTIQILSALQVGGVQVAQNYIQTLSSTIKANDAAKAAPKVNAPLDKITPSNTTGSGKSGDFSVSEWRKIHMKKSNR